MRIAGHNVLAIAVAAIVMYGLGAAIYGLLFSAQWQAATNFNKDDYVGLEWRMALSPVMPILIATGLSIVQKWRNQSGLSAGAVAGFTIALVFLVPVLLYSFVYSTESEIVLAIDTLHMFLISIVGGAIIGAWK
jgi:hypothetical protein